MDPERRDVDDSLQECERKFREICMKVINKKQSRSSRKKLFDNARPTPKISLRPSMIDRACLKKAVISSTPMPHNRQQPFTPDSSGIVSPINDSTREKEPDNPQPVVLEERASLLQVEKNSKQSVSTNDGRLQNLDNIISKLIRRRTVSEESSANVRNTTSKTVQTSKNSTERHKQSLKDKKLSKTLFGKNANTQTGFSLNGDILKSRGSVSQSSDCSGSGSDTIRSCENCGILGPILTAGSSNEDDDHFTLNVGAPWRAPSGLQKPLLPIVSSVIPNDDSQEDSMDDTFLPKPPKKKKVFANKKKKIENSSNKKEMVNSPKGRKRTEKVELDAKRKIVEKEATKENAKSVAYTDAGTSPLPTKKNKNKVKNYDSDLQNASSAENNNQLLTADSVFLPIENNRQDQEISDRRRIDQEKSFIEKDKNKKSSKSVRDQDDSIKKPQSYRKKRNVIDSDEDEFYGAVARGIPTARQKTMNKSGKEVLKDSTLHKYNAEVTRNERVRHNSKNCSSEKEYEDTNIQDRSLNEIHSEEHRGKTREIKVTPNGKLDRAREKIRGDDLIGNAQISTSNSTVNESRITRSQVKQKQYKQQSTHIQTEIHSEEHREKAKKMKVTPNGKLDRTKEKIRVDILQDNLIEDAQISTSNSTVTEARVIVSPVKQKQHKQQSAKIQTEIHSEENREKTKKMKVTPNGKLDRTKEKIRAVILQDDLIGDAQISTSHSTLNESRVTRSQVKQKQYKQQSTKIQADVLDVSQNVLLDRIRNSVFEFETTTSEERISPKKQTKESNIDIISTNKSTGRKQTKSKKKQKKSVGLVEDLQTTSQFHPTNNNIVDEILPPEVNDQSIDVEDSLNLSNFPKRHKKKDSELNKDSTIKHQSTDQIKMEHQQNSSNKNKKGSTAPEVKETPKLSYVDSGFGSSSQQFSRFKKPAPVIKPVTKKVESVEEASTRRSTRTRRPPPQKTVGFIICTSQREVERINRASGLTCMSSFEPSVAKSVPSQKRSTSSFKRKNTRGASLATPSRFSVIAESDSKTNFDFEDLQPSTSPSDPDKEKNHVLNGRTQKRRNKKSDKKILMSLNKTLENSPSQLSDILNICDGDKVREIKWSLRYPKYTKLKDMPGVSACVVNNFSNGLLKIDGGKNKPRQVAAHHQLSFCIIKGRGQVGVEDQSQMFTEEENFIVPPGSEYFIKNLNDEKPLVLFFTKIPIPKSL